jgi:hypothetical protein
MAQKLRPPKFEEGFSKITIVKLKKSSAEANPVEIPVEPQAEPEPSVTAHDPADIGNEE